MRFAVGGLPQDEIAAMLGGNAARIFGFDVAALKPIADRIAPTVDYLGAPLPAVEAPPDALGWAFTSKAEPQGVV